MPDLSEAIALLEAMTRGADGRCRRGRRPGVDWWRIEATEAEHATLYGASLCILVQGRKQAHFEAERLAYGAGRYLVAATTMPMQAEILEASPQKPMLGVAIQLDVESLGEIVVEMGPDAAPVAAPGRLVEAPAMDAGFVRAVTRLLEAANSDTDWRVLGPGLVREMHYRALQGPGGPLLRSRVEQNGNIERVARAVRYIEQNFTESLTVDGIAKQAGMSPSVLHARFKQATGKSPIEFGKQLRLHHAKRRLLAGESVTDAAFGVGYASASQFSREFKRQFGVAPSGARELLERPSETRAARTA